MHAVIVGCGRVGAELADTLTDRGFTVSIIDKEPGRFEQRLHKSFKGRTFVGLAFDRTVLEAAGIENAQIFIAATNGDNSNIVSARIAKEHYNVPKVTALIYDPRRAQIYERLGISTVATVAWTTDQLLARVLPSGGSVDATIGTGDVVVTGLKAPSVLITKPVHTLNSPGKLSVSAITRFGNTLVTDEKLLVQEGDFLHIVVLRALATDVESLLLEAADREKQ